MIAGTSNGAFRMAASGENFPLEYMSNADTDSCWSGIIISPPFSLVCLGESLQSHGDEEPMIYPLAE
jgi:hypothetical protein